jgi:fructose-1,6-bisphosphatase I
MKHISVDHFIINQQQTHVSATGEFSQVLSDIIFASKIIASKTRSAGLKEILGSTNNKNATGDQVQKLDMYAHDVFIKIFQKGGRFAAISSEESDELVLSPIKTGKYIIHLDPLDGSSNIDVNVSVGTIFSIHRLSKNEKPNSKSALKKGLEQVCAGYVLYGSSTMLVYSTGNGVHGFTLDTDIGEFLLSHPNIKLPKICQYYSVNEGYQEKWDQVVSDFVIKFKQNNIKARYIGSFVADFHRNLLKGGIFMYPADIDNPQGKLRIMYESNPLAYIIKEAGGYASDGTQSILNIQPHTLHQKTPLFIGDKKLVKQIEKQYIKLNKGVK